MGIKKYTHTVLDHDDTGEYVCRGIEEYDNGEYYKVSDVEKVLAEAKREGAKKFLFELTGFQCPNNDTCNNCSKVTMWLCEAAYLYNDYTVSADELIKEFERIKKVLRAKGVESGD